MNLVIRGLLESSSTGETFFKGLGRKLGFIGQSLSFIIGSGLQLHSMKQSCSFTCSTLRFCVRGNFTPHNRWRNQSRLMVSNSSTGTKAWQHLFSYLTKLHWRSDFVTRKTSWWRSSLSCMSVAFYICITIRFNLSFDRFNCFKL